MRVYERVEPAGRCVTPDGHDYQEHYTLADRVPVRIICPNCSQPWGIVVFDEVQPDGRVGS